MFKMIITLDEDRMKKDGLDVIASWAHINELMDSTGDIVQPEKGVFITKEIGAQDWLMELLEGTPWFMKYVSSWKTDDGDIKDDVIAGLRDLGIKCCYA